MPGEEIQISMIQSSALLRLNIAKTEVMAWMAGLYVEHSNERINWVWPMWV